ncbi:MAG TPA: hypothetical protein [Caudoviricetes sp.]|nr:MAG TPA: hypothetical protein [Caudoviricetes sp.]
MKARSVRVTSSTYTSETPNTSAHGLGQSAASQLARQSVQV